MVCALGGARAVHFLGNWLGRQERLFCVLGWKTVFSLPAVPSLRSLRRGRVLVNEISIKKEAVMEGFILLLIPLDCGVPFLVEEELLTGSLTSFRRVENGSMVERSKARKMASMKKALRTGEKNFTLFLREQGIYVV